MESCLLSWDMKLIYSGKEHHIILMQVVTIVRRVAPVPPWPLLGSDFA